MGAEQGTPAADNSDLQWVSASGGDRPCTAICAGYDSGKELYIIRSLHGGGIVPGKLHISHSSGYIPYGGKEISVDNYEVLCGSATNLAWVTCSEGMEIPQHALPGGKESTGETLYIGRAKYNGVGTIGKVHPSHKTCYIPYAGNELGFASYDILVKHELPDPFSRMSSYSRNLTWVSVSGGNCPANAIRAGHDNGKDLYIARAEYGGGAVPGKLHVSHVAAHIPYGGKEIAVIDYEVLCGSSDDFSWVSCSGTKIPAEAVAGGCEATGAPLYIGRVQHNGTLTVGKVQSEEGVCYIPYGGVEHKFTNYEILVTDTSKWERVEVATKITQQSSRGIEEAEDGVDDEFLVIDAILDQSLVTKLKPGNTRIPTTESGKATLAAEISHRLNEEIFNVSHADIVKELRREGKKEGAIAKLMKEKYFDTVAVAISKDGRKIRIAGNVKMRTRWEKRFWHSTEYGLQEARHKQVIASILKEQFPQLQTSKIDVVRPRNAPRTAEANAEFHAEMQLLSFIGEVSDNPIGVNKPPCAKCLKVLDEVGVISLGQEGKSLDADKVRNWTDLDDSGIEHGFNIQNKKITFDHNMRGKSFKELMKGVAKPMVFTPAKIPTNRTLASRTLGHLRNHVNVNVKPQVGISAGAGLENIINNIDNVEGYSNAEVLHTSAGTYTTRCSTGAYARASTAEAVASFNVFSASANGPAVSAGAHSGVGTWGAVYANADVARAEATAGPLTVGVGLNANTGASVGVDGFNASVLGFGVSIGPRLALRTPIADIACSIM